jgi:hypothetical protein
MLAVPKFRSYLLRPDMTNTGIARKGRIDARFRLCGVGATTAMIAQGLEAIRAVEVDDESAAKS